MQELGRCLGMVEPFGEHSECERLDVGNGLISGGPVAEHAGQVRDLGNPPTIVLEFEFDSETVAHGPTVT